MRAEQSLIWFLRITAMMLLTAAGAVVMPHAWMAAIHAWLGLGALPELPLVGYLTRSVSALYASLGAVSWFLSRDVRSYLPLLGFVVQLNFVFGAALVAIDVAVGMPIWWMASEGAFLLGWTLVLWRLVQRVHNQP